MPSMADIGQDADARIRIPGALGGRTVLIYGLDGRYLNLGLRTKSNNEYAYHQSLPIAYLLLDHAQVLADSGDFGVVGTVSRLEDGPDPFETQRDRHGRLRRGKQSAFTRILMEAMGRGQHPVRRDDPAVLPFPVPTDRIQPRPRLAGLINEYQQSA